MDVGGAAAHSHHASPSFFLRPQRWKRAACHRFLIICPQSKAKKASFILQVVFMLFSSFNCSVMSNSVTPWTAACQAPLSFTISWSLLRFMSIEWVMLSNHLILCWPLLLLPSVFPSIKVFSIHTHVWASLVAQTVKNLPAMQETQVWFLSQEDPLEKGIDNPLQYSCLENSMDRGVWWTTVHGAAENWTWLSD